MQPQYVVLDYQIDRNCMPYDDTPLPQYMMVDYIRYYELNNNYCNEEAIILNTSQLYSFYGVRRKITIGNGVNVIALNSNDTKTLRASESITINSCFSAPLGCELNLIPTLCDY